MLDLYLQPSGHPYPWPGGRKKKQRQTKQVNISAFCITYYLQDAGGLEPIKVNTGPKPGVQRVQSITGPHFIYDVFTT